MGVHSRQVNRSAPGGSLEFFPAGEGSIRPRTLIPTMPHDGSSTTPGGDGVEQFPSRADPIQTERAQGDTRLCEVDMRVNKTRCNQRAPEINDFHGVVSYGRRCL